MDKARGPVFENLGEVRRRSRSPDTSGHAGKRSKWPGRLLVLALAGAGVTLLAVEVAPRLFTTSSSPRLSMLVAAGVRESGGAFQVDRRITLTWASTPRADRYRLQVAIAPKGTRVSDTRIFSHPYLSALTTRTSYSLRLGSPGAYYWRVRGTRHGTWGPYAPSRRFVVIPPVLAAPVPLAPPDRSAVSHAPRLCWSAVQGAGGYEVRITGHHLIVTSGTCTSPVLRPGAYMWRVAAFVRVTLTSGSPHLYTSRYSWAAHVTVRAAPKPARRTQPAQRTVSQAPIPPAPVRQVLVPSASLQKAPVQPAPVRPQPVRAPQRQHPPARPAPVQPAPVYRPPVQPTPAPRPQPSPGPSGCIPLYTC